MKNHSLTFHRQKIINHYIVDFYCSNVKLVIEVDGKSHFTKEALEYDIVRTEILKGYNLKVLRFTNSEIYSNFKYVCNFIENEISSRKTIINDFLPY